MSDIYIQTKRGSALKLDSILEFNYKKRKENENLILYALVSFTNKDTYPRNEIQIHVAEFENKDDLSKAMDELFKRIHIAIENKEVLVKTENLI